MDLKITTLNRNDLYKNCFYLLNWRQFLEDCMISKNYTVITLFESFDYVFLTSIVSPSEEITARIRS